MAVMWAYMKMKKPWRKLRLFKEGELDKNSVVEDSLTTASDGKNCDNNVFVFFR